MEIIFLGTSSAVPTRERNHAGIVFKGFGEVILFDCGEGTQKQFIEANVSPMKINKIFISHYHGDHILGLAGLLQSMGLRGRTKELDIYGPKGLNKLINAISNTGYFKIEFKLNIHEINDEIIVDNDKYIIKCAKTEHNITNLSYSIYEKKKPRFLREKAIELGVKPGPLFGKLHNGEEIEIDGKIIKPEQVLGPARDGMKITYSGDTRPSFKLIELAENSTLLIHEATFEESDRENAIENAHSTSKDAAEIAKAAGVKNLVLTHISPRYTNVKQLKKEAQEVFKNTEVAKDFMFIEIKNTDEIVYYKHVQDKLNEN